MKGLNAVLLLLLLSPVLVLAQAVELYQAEVEVADQGVAARSKGMSQAMGQVLLKVSGTNQVLLDGGLQSAMQQASRYAQRYQYRSETIQSGMPQQDASGQPKNSRLMMQVEFDPRGINALLRQQGHAVWGHVRPMTLVWMAVEDRGTRTLVGADDAGLVRQLLQQNAQQRALPLQLPLLDLEDQSQVRVADIWGSFHHDVLRASARYHAQAVLIGRLYPLSRQQWEVRWTLLHDGEHVSWELRSDDVSVLIASGVDQSGEWLASRFAKFVQDSDGALILHVAGVADLRAYRRLIDYLSRTSGVRSITLDTLHEDTIRLLLAVDGGREAMMRTIALGGVLEKVAEMDSQELHYRLRH